MKKFFLFAAAALMALVGCEKQTQSSLQFADVKKEATITGQLGFWYAAPGQATKFIGLGGQKIWFEVGANQYDGDAPVTALNVFEVTTSQGDSAGYFTITVPMGETSITGDLKTDMIRYVYEGKVLYFKEYSELGVKIIAGNTKTKQVVVDKDEVLSECVGEGTLTGKITRDAGTIKVGDSYEDADVPAVGYTVVAHVTYQKTSTTTIDKDYTAVTDAQGKYEFKAIPAYDGAGNKVKIEVKQKLDEYRKFENNTWIIEKCYYSLAPYAAQNVKVAEVTEEPVQKLTKGAAQDEGTKGNVKKFNVSGTLYKEIEALTEDKDGHCSGKKVDKTIVKGQEVTLEVNNPTQAKSLFFKATTDDKGNYEFTDVAVYDNWDITNDGITLKVYVEGVLPCIAQYENGKLVKNTGFEHYHLGYKTKADKGVDYYYEQVNKWYGKFEGDTKDVDQAETQVISGTYNNKVGTAWKSVSKDANLYFDYKMADLILDFEPEDKTQVYGLGYAVDKEDGVTWANKGTGTVTSNTIYGYGTPVVW